MGVYSVGEVADQLTERFGVRVRPRQITNLFSERALRDDLCPIKAGRRVVPESYVPMIVAELRRRGTLRKGEG
ncbi:hypothetical protein [Lacipirellula parvula]|uniref:Uncharacterized protein n=1 Tax=Lacipirellula parvula TaxID=2650471 RepID=A0A5K7XCD8_9BACT|nr:hypothetical protein [Lacipirellula parvula]BBO32511.1 hypothetical protein PLANPX_2123 [Lacipirellula parvula]